MLEVTNLSSGYHKTEVLHDINLFFEKGKFYAVIGKNGSGKSTLVDCISSVIKYDGSISFDGENIKGMSVSERAKRISLLPQQVLSVPFTVRELCGFGRNPYGDITTSKDIIDKALETAGIFELADKKVNEISGGERQLCYFAMNLCQDSDIMILDEPVSNLDIEHEAKILSLAKEKCNGGKTVICVMHNLSQAVRFADGIVILDKGKCVFFGSKETCLEKEMIEKYFGVRRFDSDGEIFFSV